MFYAAVVLVVGSFIVSSCKHSNQEPSDSDPKVLASKFGANKLYLWNTPISSSQDKTAKSCWYYKEAMPREELSEEQAMIQSVRLNTHAIADDQIEKQLQRLLMEKVAAAGGDLVPCGISAVSLAAALQTAGASAVVLGVNSAWAATNCIKNTPKVIQSLTELRGVADGKVALRNGEVAMGRKSNAGKAELDMFRQAIKRAINLGLESKIQCRKPIEFQSEIERLGMGG